VGVDQVLDLADRNAAIEPGQDFHHPLYVFFRIQAVPFGRAVRHDQAVATFPGAQGHGIHAGLPCHLTDRNPALFKG